jgi:L-ascorbate metabolism protein UlaG (beta-lactamase superfamily)
VLYAGDTAYTPVFERVARPDLAVFGIGAYDPWRHAHATPEEVWSMARAAGATEILPVHHSTFELSDEPADEPIRRLLAAAGGDKHRVLRASPGEVMRYGRG